MVTLAIIQSGETTMTKLENMQARLGFIALLWCFVGTVVFVLWCKYSVVDSSGNEDVDFLVGWCVQFPILCFCVLCWMRALWIIAEEMR